MEKRFNLKKSRYDLVRQLREDFGIHNSKAWKIVKIVEEQDKEFIRLLKERNTITHQIDINDVLELSGDLNGN